MRHAVQWRLLWLLPLILACATPAHSFITRGLSAKYRNLSNRPVKLYWIEPNGKFRNTGHLDADGGETSFQSYEGHRFFFSEADADPPQPISTPGAEGASFTITLNQTLYVFKDDTTHPALLATLADELKFMKEYKNRTGRDWIAYWPRPKPLFPIWSCDFVGQTHQVWIQPGGEHVVCSVADKAKPECAPKELTLTLKCESISPRVFSIEGFLSDYEADFVVESARPHMHRSTVGDSQKVDVRTSSSYWMSRGHSHVSEALYRRVADVLRFPRDTLWHNRNAESLNILRYTINQQYFPHYDWGSHGGPESRMVTMGMYFNTPERGGATGFPYVPSGQTPIHYPAVKTNAVIFYNLLADGNLDEYSLHEGEPVASGEKWFGALWIWDPHVRDGIHPRDLLAAENQREDRSGGSKDSTHDPLWNKEWNRPPVRTHSEL